MPHSTAAAMDWMHTQGQLYKLEGLSASRQFSVPLARDHNLLPLETTPVSFAGQNTPYSQVSLNVSESVSKFTSAFDAKFIPGLAESFPALLATTGMHEKIENNFSGLRDRIDQGPGWIRDFLGSGAYWMVLGGSTSAASWGLHQGFDPTHVMATVTVASFFVTLGLENAYPLKKNLNITNKEYSTSILHSIFSAAVLPELGKKALAMGAAYFLAHEIFEPLRHSGLNEVYSLQQLPFYAQVAAGLVIADFGWYWLHRFLHVNKTFWKLHEVHHLSENMTSLATGVNHPINLLLSYLILVGTLKVLNVDDSAAAIIMGGIVAPNDFLKHSNAKLDIGQFGRWIINDNKLHGFHHSSDPAEYDVNFGNTLSIWDRLFGTLYDPADRVSVDAVGVQRPYLENDKSALGNFLEHTWYPVKDIAKGFLASAKKYIG